MNKMESYAQVSLILCLILLLMARTLVFFGFNCAGVIALALGVLSAVVGMTLFAIIVIKE